MADEVIVTWHNSYSIGIKLIDEQHMNLIGLANKLFRSYMSGHERTKSDSIFPSIINEIKEYAAYHFTTEERVMERINYSDYKIHKEEHMVFAKGIFNKLDEFNHSKNNASLSLAYYLKDWIHHHIAISDKQLSIYLLHMKREGLLYQIVLKAKKDAETNKILIE